MSTKTRLIAADALDTAINAEQIAHVSDDDRQWQKDKPYNKGLATARKMIREAPTIAELSTFEIAGLRGMIYRGQFPERDVVSDLLARAEKAEAQLSRYTESGLEPCDYAAMQRALEGEKKAKHELENVTRLLLEAESRAVKAERERDEAIMKLSEKILTT